MSFPVVQSFGSGRESGRKRERIALNLLSCSHVSVSVLYIFLVVPWVGLWYAIVALRGFNHLLYGGGGLPFWDLQFINVSFGDWVTNGCNKCQTN